MKFQLYNWKSLKIERILIFFLFLFHYHKYLTLSIELPSSSQHCSSLGRERTCPIVAILVGLILARTRRTVALHHLVTADRRRNRAAAVTPEKFHLPGQLHVTVQAGLA